MTSSTLDRPTGLRVGSPAGAAAQLGRHARDARAAARQRREERKVTAPPRPTRSVPRRARERVVHPHQVLGRVVGLALTAAAVTAALASTEIAQGTAGVALLAQLSIRGVAAATVLAAAWAFQDRRSMGARRTTRCWLAVSAGVGVAHATWLAMAAGTVSTDPRALATTVTAALLADTVLVAVPALLGCRAAGTQARPA